MDAGAARRAVHLANRLERLPATQKAFDAGEISRAHAQVIANGYTDERAEQLACIEEGLVDFAKKVDPKSLRAAVGRYTDAIDGDGGAGDDEKAYAKNRFHCSLVGDRVRGDLSLDPEAGEIVSAAVEAMAADLKVEGDQRRTSQKHADAIVEICRRSLLLNHKHVSPSSRRRGQSHLSFIVDLQDHEADHPDLVAAMRVEGERYGRLSQATLERLTCDCNIDRIITDGKSLIVDVGRTTRKHPRPALAGARRPRPALHRTRLQSPARLLRRPPHLVLGKRRTHRPRQPQTPLLGPPPKTPPRSRPKTRMSASQPANRQDAVVASTSFCAARVRESSRVR